MPSKRDVQTVMTNSILNLSAGSSVDAPGLPSQSESLNQAIMLSYVQASTHHHLRSAYLGLCARQQFDLPVINHLTQLPYLRTIHALLMTVTVISSSSSPSTDQIRAVCVLLHRFLFSKTACLDPILKLVHAIL